MRRLILWLVMDGPINLGRLAPHLFAFGIGCKKYREI